MKSAFFLCVTLLSASILPFLSKKWIFTLQQLSYSSKRYLKTLFSGGIFKSVNRRPKRQTLDLTNRVKRIIIFIELAYLATAAITGFLIRSSDDLAFMIKFSAFVAIYLALSPIFVILGHIISLPSERIIAGYYEYLCKKRIAKAKTVIGVTGSYGKTTVKNVLTTLLREKYSVFSTPYSYNTPMGIAKSVNDGYNGEEIAVIEMGARKRGDIKRLCGIVEPDISVITSIGKCHLESFKSEENILLAKSELMRYKSVKRAYFGENAEVLYDLCDISKRRRNSRFSAGNEAFTLNGTSFDLKFDGEKEKVTTRLIGRHIIDDLLLSIEVASDLGLTKDEITRAIPKILPIPHRLELIPSNDLVVIDDSYNANPESARSALETVGSFEGKKFVITSGFVELGKSETEENERLGEEISKHCDFAILIGKERAVPIESGLKRSGFQDDRILIKDSLEDAVNALSTLAKRGDLVLFLNDLPDIYLR